MKLFGNTFEFLTTGKKGKVFTFTGPSGVGKSTLANLVFEKEVVSHTTRQPRDGEIDGVHYHFITVEKFDEMNANGEFCETTRYPMDPTKPGNFYGVTKKAVEDDIKKYGKAVIVCDDGGRKQIKEAFPDAISIFVYGSLSDVEANIRARGDKEESIKLRLSLYEKEIKVMDEYDYTIQNFRGMLNQTAEVLKEYIKNV